ncbi:translocation/assembly module TamB domain-containing protein [Crenothrix polyspora]|uniref:Translocation and assembly module TamB n=1 Tax=Crenothrix polyspora TaxID=360316 RepID=A0A1R4HGR3_9GAMM|nr:translocation/assembly module TamB domain-containing protein [Crenothrix polyspora]SJM95060.1 Translocation and assembly module TamB [Crenothrix polyspora]
MKKRWGIFLLLLVLMIPITLFGLISNESGSRWLLQRVFLIIPAQISVESITGRLIDRLTLTGFNVRTDTETVIIKKVSLIWQPYRLLSGILKIDDLTVNGLDINMSPTKDPEKKSADFETGIQLPFQLDIGKVLITDVKFTSDGQLQIFDKLQLSAKTEANQFKLLSLTINSDTLNATAKGAVTLDKGFPLNLQANWQIKADKNGLWQGLTTISGDFSKLVFDNQLVSPFKLALHGSVEDVLTTPRITAQGDWHNLTWPLSASPPQIQSPQRHFDVAGLLNAYQLKLNGQLVQRYLPQAQLSFDGKGSLEAITIKKLELKSTTGLFQLAGNASWGNVPMFDLTATGQKFNLAIFNPQLPGSLTFGSHLKGKLDPKALQITAEINKLTGQLRNYPVNANGKLVLNGEQLKVDAVSITSGPNKIAVDGQVGQGDGTLVLSMDMPTLATLWPTLDGSLKGNGRIQGSWKKPTVTFEAQGKRLQFADYKSEKLAINLDYHHDEQKISAVNLSANNLLIGTTTIEKLSIAGKGTLKQHNFKAEMSSPQGKVSTALTGGLIATTWKGAMSKLTVTDQDNNRWVLKNTLALRVDKKPLGFDVAIDEGCLVRQSASLCTKASYLANSDLNLQFIAKSVPTALIQAYLPKQMTLKSLINGNVDIQRQKNTLSGRYRVDMTPAQIFLTTQETKREINVGASSVSGTLNGDKVSADINLLLAGRDYVQGHILMDTGKTQVLSGKIAASLADFSPLQAFVPQLSDIKGLLKADLALQGSLKKPLVTGYFDLSNGAVNIGQAEAGQLGLRSIDFHVVTRGGNRIQLHGSAIPIALNKPNATETLNIKSSINFDADLQQGDVLAGSFHLAMPANTSLSLVSKEAHHEIVLGASSLSGNIHDELISANLEVALTDSDYVRGALQINTGKTQALSGQATASIRDFTFIEPFAPQLSHIKGLLKADMTVTGTTQNPLANGGIQLSNGAADVDQLGLGIHDVNLQAMTVFSQSDILQIKGSAKSGDGLIKVDGTVGLQPDKHYPIALTLTGKDFEIAKLPEAQIAVSPDLKIALTEQQKHISGQLDVPKAILKIQDIPENAVKVSADEIIIGEEKPEDTTLPAPDINADIDVKLGKQVSFTGQGLQTNLLGHLKIIKTGTKMAMQGNVDMDKASYKRFGQALTVRKGQLLFNGPVDNPWLVVEAIRLSKSKKVTAILKLTGSLKAPQTLISSEPALPEAEALAYLVTGGPLNEVSKKDSNMLASAALSYGAGQTSWLAEKLGINEFNVEEGNTLQDTLLVMGQYLTPDFYIGTKIGLFNKQASLVLKRKLTNSINVETQTGTSQRIKLNYEFDDD